MEIQFASFDQLEEQAVQVIISRTRALYERIGLKPPSKLTIRMDLSCVHHLMPLRLTQLAEADDFNFSHDMLGIAQHLNRETGEMEDCFVPRFTQPRAA